MIEAKAAFVASDGLRLGDWVLTRLDWFSAGHLVKSAGELGPGESADPLADGKDAGVAQGRKLPRFAPRVSAPAHRRRLTRPTRRTGRKVLYFVDTYANYHDTQLAETSWP